VVTRNGQQIRAGVGLSHWQSLGEQVVKFPSSLQKVTFKAQQVTRELSGIEVQGFAIWGVYRTGEGPYKAYRNLDGMSAGGLLKAQHNLASMAESIVRAQVANMTIQDVITQRRMMRNKLTEGMMEIVKGWGIWLETVEVTDVRILSQSLFNNMQSRFREDTRRTAEKLHMKVQQEIDSERLKNDMQLQTTRAAREQELETIRIQHARDLANSRANAQRERSVHKMQQELKENQAKAALEEQQHTLALAREKRLHDAAMHQARQKAELAAENLKHAHQARLAEAELQSRIHKMKLAVEQTMSDVNVESQRMQTLKDIYASLPLRDIKVVSVTGAPYETSSHNGSTLASMLPGAAAALHATAP